MKNNLGLRAAAMVAVVAVMALFGVARSQELLPVKGDSEAKGASSPANTEQPLFDDDGGRVFVVSRSASSLRSLSYHGGAVIAAPRQYNIFLGDAWSQPSFRARESAFSNLLTQKGAALDQSSLESYGVKNIYQPAESREQPFDFAAGASISDLQIRAALEGMLRTGVITAPDAETVFVVFLPAGVRSTLGTMVSGKHYAAYHNFFHAEQGEVRYAVVPYEAESKQARRIAARALLEAALNPTGTGWY